MEALGLCWDKVDFLHDQFTVSRAMIQKKQGIVKSDLPAVRLHDLRHSTASNLLANGFSVVEVQHWLGHSQASTTLNFYSHIDFSSKNNIKNALENLLPLEKC